MGVRIFDKFTYLHFASGVVAQYFGLSFIEWLLMHTIFEIVENTKHGVYFIDTYLTFWPGGKLASDSFINSVGDTLGALLGWLSAALVTHDFR
jgi:hypothetical protein